MEPNRAPVKNVQLSSGERVPLSQIYERGTGALVFLRHLGCPFCREQVVAFRQFPDWNLWFVVPVAADSAASFKHQFQIPHQLVCDPFRDLYRDFGLKSGGLTSTIGPKIWGPGLRTLARGNAPGLFKGNMFQLGGVAVLSPQGEILYKRTFSASSEEATSEELSSWLA